MKNLREYITDFLPKVVSNLVLVLIFWFTRFIVLIIINPINSELTFLLQTGLLIVTGIFLVRALFNTLNIFDRLTGSLLNRLGITEKWSQQRILKDALCIVTIILVAAALVPLFESISHYDLIQQITTYVTLCLIILFVFDIGRNFYRMTEEKANSVADRISNSISNEEK